MEPPLILRSVSFGHHPMEGIMCRSPLSSFGDDFTILCQNSLAQQNRKHDGIIHPTPDNNINSNSKEEMKTLTITVTEEKLVEVSQVKDTIDIDDELKNAEKRTGKCKIPNDILEKYGSKTTQQQKKKVKQEKKGKKWKTLSTVEMGFKISLFPRPTIDNLSSEKDAEGIFNKIERECDELESLTENFEKLQDMEGCLSGNMKLEIRPDRDRKVEKAHNQVKTKYCKNVTNNQGRKRLYIHHRIYKLMRMEITISLNYMPSRKRERFTLSREEVKNAFTSKKVKEPNVAPRPPPQNLAYALDNHNASMDLDSAMVNVLIGLQHRDLTPEDYELLLRLDEQVAPKTVSSNTIRNFKTETIDLTIAGELCTICMEVYEVGQTRKFLPCTHHFHSDCIEMWLTNSSVNCPIDNLPVEPS